MPLSQISGTLGKKKAAHLLRRATFGPTKADIDSFAGMTITTAITKLFETVSEPPLPLDPKIAATWIGRATDKDEKDQDRQRYVRGWWLGQMMGIGVPDDKKLAYSTRERIVFFLHTHFTVISDTIENSRALYYQNALLRKYALDDISDPKINFKELTKKIAVDNAMVGLLNGNLNGKGNPNENLARELLELYSIGKGLPSNPPQAGIDTVGGIEYNDYGTFTELDVKQTAKVLSGYDFDNEFLIIDQDTSLPRAKMKGTPYPNQHDLNDKTFSKRFKNTTITTTPTPVVQQNGTTLSFVTQESLLKEVNDLVEMIFEQSEMPDEAAKNICRKLYRFYIYHNITKDIDDTIISGLAATFKSNGYKIQPVIKEILSSAIFFDSDNASIDDDQFGAIIKSPLDLTLGTLRFFEYQFPDYITDTEKFYKKTSKLLESLRIQGMDFMNPSDVAGYEAYHQFPIWNRSWISTNALTNRYNSIYIIMRKIVETTENEEIISIDVLSYFKSKFSANILDPDALVRDFASYILPMYSETSELTLPRLNYFKQQFLILGKVNDNATTYWQGKYVGSSSSTDDEDIARGFLQYLVNSMLQSPEYQLF